MIEQRIYTSDYDEDIPHLFFRCEEVSANTEYLPHAHPWGQLLYMNSGLLALNVDSKRLIAPSKFAVWVPAGMEHSSFNRKLAQWRTVNISQRLCRALPRQACLLNVTPIFTAIVDDFFQRNVMIPRDREDIRLARVLVEQIRLAQTSPSYLPATEDKFLSPILAQLEQNPADNTPLSTWAERVFTTERTLSRRCQQELGMSFSEWRQRLRFLHGIALLGQGKTVQSVALDVGYSSSSAFIAMFQQIAGTTPERYRQPR